MVDGQERARRSTWPSRINNPVAIAKREGERILPRRASTAIGKTSKMPLAEGDHGCLGHPGRDFVARDPGPGRGDHRHAPPLRPDEPGCDLQPPGDPGQGRPPHPRPAMSRPSSTRSRSSPPLTVNRRRESSQAGVQAVRAGRCRLLRGHARQAGRIRRIRKLSWARARSPSNSYECETILGTLRRLRVRVRPGGGQRPRGDQDPDGHPDVRGLRRPSRRARSPIKDSGMYEGVPRAHREVHDSRPPAQRSRGSARPGPSCPAAGSSS